MALKFYNKGQEGVSEQIRQAVLKAGEQMGGRDFGVTSGYRSPEHNARVGGAKQSYHTRGQAMDIDLRGMSDQERGQLVQLLAGQGVGGFITYSNSPHMLHIDMRQTANGKPHFMHDRSAANIGRAPAWLQQIATGKVQAQPEGGETQRASTGLGELLGGKSPNEYLADKAVASAPVRNVAAQVAPATINTALMNQTPIEGQAGKFVPPPSVENLQPDARAAMFAPATTGALPFQLNNNDDNSGLGDMFAGLSNNLTADKATTGFKTPEQIPTDDLLQLPEFRTAVPDIKAPELQTPNDTVNTLAEVFTKLQTPQRPVESMFRPSRKQNFV